MPGVYPIGCEAVTDDDLSMLSDTGGLAILDLYDSVGDGGITQATALTGTVTLTTVRLDHIQGTFSVELGTFVGDTLDRQNPIALSGSFDSTPM